MSNKLATKQFFILFAFFSFGFLSTFLFNKFSKNEFANNENKTAKILFNTKLGKQLSFVNVQLEFLNLANDNEDVSEIKAYVTLLKSSNNEISYKWNLPEGVFVVSGSAEGSLTNIDIEAPQELVLKVTGFSKMDKKLISLSANTMIGESAFGNVGLISSRPEDSYEFIANQNYQNGSIQQIDLSSESAPVAPRDEKIQR